MAFVSAALLLVSCSKPNQTLVRQLALLQSAPKSSVPAKESITQLEREVAKYQRDVNRAFEATRNLGHAEEMLGLQYLSHKMYGMALKSFQQALQIYPSDPALFYVAGLCQGEMAKIEVDSQVQRTLFEQAASYYKNALGLDPNYQDALYALSILDVYELNKPVEAQPILQHLLSLDAKNTNAMFLLARVEAGNGQAEEAAALYDRIIKTSSSQEVRTKAEAAKRSILESAYGK